MAPVSHEMLLQLCPAHSDYLFFRAPGAAWITGDAKRLNAAMLDNETLNNKYIGPIFWDFGNGHRINNAWHGADWAPYCKGNPLSRKIQHATLLGLILVNA